MADIAPAGGGTPGLDLEALSKQIDETISKAIGARLNRGTLEKLINEKIAATLGGEGIEKAVESAILKMADAAPAEPKPGNGAQTQAGNGAQPAAGAAQQPQDDPRIVELQKQLAKMQRQLETEKKAAEQAAMQARESRVLSHAQAKLREALGGNDTLAKVLAKDLVKDRQWVVEQPDGSFAWKVTRPDGLGGQTSEAIAFDEGLKAWAGSEEGKSLIPARPQQVFSPPGGMPFPYDPSASTPGAFRQPGGAQGKVNPVLATMAHDIAGTDPTFATQLMQQAQIGPVKSGT